MISIPPPQFWIPTAAIRRAGSLLVQAQNAPTRLEGRTRSSLVVAIGAVCTILAPQLARSALAKDLVIKIDPGVCLGVCGLPYDHRGGAPVGQQLSGVVQTIQGHRPVL